MPRDGEASVTSRRSILTPPWWALYALAVVLVLAIVPLAGLLPTAACLIALSATGLALVIAVRSKGDVIPIPPVTVAFSIAGLACLLQCIPLPSSVLEIIASHNASTWHETLALLGSTRSWSPISLAPETSLVEAAKWLGYAATGWIAFVWARAHGGEKICWLVLGIGSFAAISTLLHGLLDAHRVWGVYKPLVEFPRWTMGPILNVNHLSALLNLGLFCGLALLFSRRKFTTVPSLFLMAQTSMLMIGVMILASRAAVGLLLMGVLVSIAVRGGKKDPKSSMASGVLVPSLLIASMGLAFLGFRKSIENGLSEKDLSKFRVVRDALPMIRDHWLVGVGRGGFETSFYTYRSDSGFDSWTHAENIVIQWTTEWGLPISILIAGVLVLGVWDARAWRDSTLVRIVLLGLLVLAAHNCFDFSLEVPAVAMPAAVLLGAVLGTRSTKPRRWTRWELSRRSLSTGALGVAFVVCSCVAVMAPLLSGAERIDQVRSTVFARAKESPKSIKALIAVDMMKYPADPYLPYVAALVIAPEHPLDAMRWLNVALERSPRNGAIHLAIADTLVKLGAGKQALVHMKILIGYDAKSVEIAGARVAKYANSADEIIEFVANGPPWEERFLSAVLGALPPDSPIREPISLIALERASCAADVRVLSVRKQLDTLNRALPACSGERRESCVKQLESDIQRIASCPGQRPIATDLRAEFLWATNQRKQALDMREESCAKAVADDLTTCLQHLVEQAAAIQDIERVRRNLRVVVSRSCGNAAGCAKGWQWAAMIHSTCNDPYAAYAALTKASELSPGDLEIRLQVADAAMKVGANEKAITMLSYILLRHPDDPVARQRLEVAKTPVRSRPTSLPSAAAAPSSTSTIMRDPWAPKPPR